MRARCSRTISDRRRAGPLRARHRRGQDGLVALHVVGRGVPRAAASAALGTGHLRALRALVALVGAVSPLVYIGLGLVAVAVLCFGVLVWIFARPDPWEKRW